MSQAFRHAYELNISPNVQEPLHEQRSRALHPAPAPHLVLAPQGLPGSGKSTLAQELARRLRWPLVDKDDVRDVLQAHSAATAAATALAAGTPAGPTPGVVDWNALSYDVMFSVAARQLGLGLSIVLDCPFARRQLYDRACEVAAQVRRRQHMLPCKQHSSDCGAAGRTGIFPWAMQLSLLHVQHTSGAVVLAVLA